MSRTGVQQTNEKIGMCRSDSIIVVGSYARGTNKENSDLDIVIVTSNKSNMIANQDFTQEFGEVYKQQTEYYGACTSIRV